MLDVCLKYYYHIIIIIIYIYIPDEGGIDGDIIVSTYVVNS